MPRTSRLGLLFVVLLSACGSRTGLRETPFMDATDSLIVDASDALIVDVTQADMPIFTDIPVISDVGCRLDAACDDGDLCTTDRCLADGTCAHGAVVCNDGDACTDDRCDPRRGCAASPTNCDDRNVCTNDRCDRVVGCLHATVVCDDRDPCTADRCDAVRGCEFPAIDCRGCADGARDAFRDVARFPRIAGCAGGFGNAGLSRESSPTCGRGAGDDGANPAGSGCSATDLCAPGWHVCRSDADVVSHAPSGCAGADAEPQTFFATRQTGPGCGHCSSGADPSCGNNDCRAGCAQTAETTNDIFGCGTLGDAPQAESCTALDRFSNNLCGALRAPWRCDADPAGLRESDVVIKPGPGAGGVLCCAD